MPYTNDVVFTEEGLKQFIKLIRENPDMIKNVEFLNYGNETLIEWNNNNPDNKIPGKGLQITFANGRRICVAVGSDIKKPADSYVGDNNTVSILVDGDPIDFKINGVVDSLTDDTNETKNPTAGAIRNYIKDMLGIGSEKLPKYIYGYLDSDKWYVQKKLGDSLTSIPGAESDTLAELQAHKVYGAVFNDYAEYRQSNGQPGRCVIETGNGDLILSTKRLQLGANIISDTFGFAIGETDNCKTPVAVCGRVLAYPYEDKEKFLPGAAVCSGPDGTVSVMTREEIKEWPDAILGFVSEIPTYDTWGSSNIKVDGRIWIKVK